MGREENRTLVQRVCSRILRYLTSAHLMVADCMSEGGELLTPDGVLLMLSSVCLGKSASLGLSVFS